MIFMSQTGITDATREAELDAWYVDHLRIMLTVKGVDSTQRFKTTSAGYPPSLAMYSVAGAHVFQDPYYLSVRGMGEWDPLIDKNHYRRNLFRRPRSRARCRKGRTAARRGPLAAGAQPARSALGMARMRRHRPLDAVSRHRGRASERRRCTLTRAWHRALCAGDRIQQEIGIGFPGEYKGGRG